MFSQSVTMETSYKKGDCCLMSPVWESLTPGAARRPTALITLKLKGGAIVLLVSVQSTTSKLRFQGIQLHNQSQSQLQLVTHIAAVKFVKVVWKCIYSIQSDKCLLCLCKSTYNVYVALRVDKPHIGLYISIQIYGAWSNSK